ncbi:hypothetical protein LguiA_028197 [Lonicera macranthoides]
MEACLCFLFSGYYQSIHTYCGKIILYVGLGLSPVHTLRTYFRVRSLDRHK